MTVSAGHRVVLWRFRKVTFDAPIWCKAAEGPRYALAGNEAPAKETWVEGMVIRWPSEQQKGERKTERKRGSESFDDATPMTGDQEFPEGISSGIEVFYISSSVGSKSPLVALEPLALRTNGLFNY